MSAVVFGEPWLRWSLALGVSFPLLAVLLGELVHRLERRGRAVAPLKEVRDVVLPSLVVFLLVREVLGYGEGHPLSRWTATLLWIFLIHSSLSMLNAVLFSGADESSWRAKVPALLRDLSRFFLVALGAAFVLSKVWGANLGSLLTALGVGSIVLGLALQDTLGNIFSGVTLLFERRLRVGDWLEAGDKVGKVIEINWRAIHLQTLNGDLLLIPNLVLSREVLRNYSFPETRHTECLRFSFSYEDPPNLVKRVLAEVAADVPAVLERPAPEILTESFGEEQVTYKVKLRLESYRHSEKVRDTMATRMWYAARRNGLTLEPGPELFELRQPEGAAPGDGGAGSRSASFVERSARLPLFRQVERQVLEDLADRARIDLYGRGERLIRQGDEGRFFFVLLSGEVVVESAAAGAPQVELARLGAGEFFGEMSLLLNEPNTASVTAAEDLEVIAISAADLHRLLPAVPDLARRIGTAIEGRSRSLRTIEAA